jgi:hypothetical protein
MSGPIYSRNRRDKSEPGVVAAFVEGGATVEKLDRPCDLLVGYLGETHLVEVKTDNGGLTDDQMRFRERWTGKPPVEVRTPAQAKKWLRIWQERRPTLSTVLRAEHEAGGGVWKAAEDSIDGRKG